MAQGSGSKASGTKAAPFAISSSSEDENKPIRRKSKAVSKPVKRAPANTLQGPAGKSRDDPPAFNLPQSQNPSSGTAKRSTTASGPSHESQRHDPQVEDDSEPILGTNRRTSGSTSKLGGLEQEDSSSEDENKPIVKSNKSATAASSELYKRKRQDNSSDEENDKTSSRPAKRPAVSGVDKDRSSAKSSSSAGPAVTTKQPIRRASGVLKEGPRKAPASTVSTGHAKELTEVDVEENDDLRNLERWLKVKDNVFVKNGRNVQHFVETDSSAQRLQRYVTGPKYKNRAVYRDKVVDYKGQTWRANFRSDPNDTSFPKKGVGVHIPMDEYPNAPDIDPLCQQLVVVLDRLPFTVTDELTKKTTFPQILLNIAKETALPGATLIRNAIKYYAPRTRNPEPGNRGNYETTLYFFDDATSALTQFTLYVPVFKDLSRIDRVPQVPDHIKYSKSPGRVTTSGRPSTHWY
jgi:hypothetical protein